MNEEIKEKTVILPPFKHFIMTVGAIPTSYLESMTYYEMLVWFTNYLGKIVIPAINENGEAVTELQNLFRELQNYVNDYFDNLDVQEEINNKLDKMVEEGTLQEIIASYLNSKALFGFDNVASMKSATNLIDGSYAKTLGYYSKNDGGKALYKIRKITNEDIVDEMFIIALTDETLIAELIYDSTINGLQIGCSTNLIDNGSKINYVLNKNLNIFLPKGTYNITTTIYPLENSNINIKGTLNYSGSEQCLKIDKGGMNIYIYSIVCDTGIGILFENNNTSTRCQLNKIDVDFITTNNHGIYLHAIKRGIVYNKIEFKKISAGTSSYGIYIKSEYPEDLSIPSYVSENIFSNGRLSRGLYGVYIDSGIRYNEDNGNHFDNLVFEGVTNGAYLKDARYNVFNYCRIDEINAPNRPYKLVGLCDCNTFNNEFGISYARIDVSEMDTTTYDNTFNYFNGFVTDGQGNRIGKNIITYRNRVYIRELLHKWLYYTVRDSHLDENYEVHFDNTKIANYFRMTTTNASTKIYLNQYFGSIGIDEIYINCIHNNPFKLYDIDNNLICDWNGTGESTFKHFVCRYIGPTTYTDGWNEV